MYGEDEAEEHTTILGLGKKTGARIPFGSSLPVGVLDVGLLCGRIVLVTKKGVPLDIMELPGWERAELIRHVDFALRNKML